MTLQFGVKQGPLLDACLLDVAVLGDGAVQAFVNAEPPVLVGLSSDSQDQPDLLRRIVAALATRPVRAVLTTGHGIDPASIEAPAFPLVVLEVAARDAGRVSALLDELGYTDVTTTDDLAGRERVVEGTRP